MASLASAPSACPVCPSGLCEHYGELIARPCTTNAEPTYHAAAAIVGAHTDGDPIEAAPVPAPEPRRVAALFSRPLPANPPYYYGEPPALFRDREEIQDDLEEGDEAAGAALAAASCFGYGWRGTSVYTPHGIVYFGERGRGRTMRAH